MGIAAHPILSNLFNIKSILMKGEDEREVNYYWWGGYASTDFRVVPDEGLYQILLRQRLPTAPRLASTQEW